VCGKKWVEEQDVNLIWPPLPVFQDFQYEVPTRQMYNDKGMPMSDSPSELLDYIQSQIEEITTIHAQAEKALNAVQGKDHVTKWKKKVVDGLAPFVSPEYLQHITKEWLETTYFVGDVFDELADEVDMCRRHLKKLAKDIQTTGIP